MVLSCSKCDFCQKDAKDLCGKCESIGYCSRSCQKQGWKTHKKVCQFITSDEMIPTPNNIVHLDLNAQKTLHFDSILDFASKYLPKVKKLTLDVDLAGLVTVVDTPQNLPPEMCKLELTPMSIQKFLYAKKAHLVEFTWHITNCWFGHVYDMVDNFEIWKELGDCPNLQSLALDQICFHEAPYVLQVLESRAASLAQIFIKNVFVVRPGEPVNWSIEECDRLSRAVANCKNLTKLFIGGIQFLDKHINMMLQPKSELTTNLRTLKLAAYDSSESPGGGLLTDLTCLIIAQRCPNLQLIDLGCQHQITEKGIQQIFERCQHLREFRFLADIDPNKLADLVSLAPSLMVWVVNSNIACRKNQIRKAIEASGGQLLFLNYSTGEIENPNNLSRKAEKRAIKTTNVLGFIQDIYGEGRLKNEWECFFKEDIETGISKLVDTAFFD